ncbi:MAG: peptide-methionine (S)-S-oxide reductase MsrA [Acidimicrobiia bacterium]|nr:MAG: peptide-methionine (S)-S-oxide reductase MsrA [Acidimicrobiia bacterium]
MFGKKKSEMVSPEDALPGRSDPMPEANVHFVNGTSIYPPFPDGMEQAVVGMGCFWGAERIFWQIPGVYTTAAGYAGGYTPNPNYEETCTGRTGHTEAVLVVYDPAEVSYERLLKDFWEQHDPTQYMGQGNDRGTQYRSAIYTFTDEQADVAKRSRDRYQALLDEKGFGSITTEIAEAGEFYYAEEYHQQYLAKNPGGYCNHGFCQVSYSDAQASE